MSNGPIRIPEYVDQPQHVADLWTLCKGRRAATCTLWTHPIGGEIRCEVSGEMVQTEAKRDGMALVDLAAAWRAQFLEKGWMA